VITVSLGSASIRSKLYIFKVSENLARRRLRLVRQGAQFLQLKMQFTDNRGSMPCTDERFSLSYPNFYDDSDSV